MRKWFDDLKRGDHVVHAYRSDEERSRALLDLIGWMREDDKFVFLFDETEGDAECFPAGRNMFEAAVQEGRLEILPSYRSVCPTGRMRPGALIDLIMVEYGRAMEDGFGGLLFGIDASWIADRPEDLPEHVVQQSQLTIAKLPSNLTLLCQYDLRKLMTEQSEQLLRVHQLALQEGKLTRNFWVVATSALGGWPRGFRPVSSPGSVATGQEK